MCSIYYFGKYTLKTLNQLASCHFLYVAFFTWVCYANNNFLGLACLLDCLLRNCCFWYSVFCICCHPRISHDFSCCCHCSVATILLSFCDALFFNAIQTILNSNQGSKCHRSTFRWSTILSDHASTWVRTQARVLVAVMTNLHFAYLRHVNHIWASERTRWEAYRYVLAPIHFFLLHCTVFVYRAY